MMLLQCVSVSVFAATINGGSGTSIYGEQKQWHKVTLTFWGPKVSESSSPNPFRSRASAAQLGLAQ